MAIKFSTQIMKSFALSRGVAWVSLATALLTTAFNASALGLGAMEVESNLDQPLRGSIELRVAPGDDINTVKAQIADRDEFERLGIDYPEYLKDIALIVENVGNGAYALRVISGDVVIKEPFIHFLVRVEWSGGNFLREYTALIDPPVYAAEQPKFVAEPKVLDGASQSYSENQAVPESSQSNQFTPSPATSAATTSELPSANAKYGPVVSGESLSMIAQELQEQIPDLSIYQIMQVLFQENRDAFIQDNINGLKKGATLQLGEISVIRNVDIAASRRFFYNQALEWDPSLLVADDTSSDYDGLRVGQDEYFADDPLGDQSLASDFDTSNSSSDSFRVGASTDSESVVSNGDVNARDAEVLALQQQITTLETSLASSSLENQELTERISLLEGQLADLNRLVSLSVEDSDMAAVEATLAEQNNAPDLDYDFSQEDAGLSNDQSTQSADDSGFIDPLAETNAIDSDNSVSNIEPIEEAQVSPASKVTTNVATAPQNNQPDSFLSSMQDSFFGNGLWKVLTALGALILGGLAFWFVRRRRADEEYEISMMSIESQSFSERDAKNTSLNNTQSVSSSVGGKGKGGDGDTSFLTVYSDSDALVQADEVDPVAEADVYIAYGRDEQAEEVLLDGIAKTPARLDIKQKLLTLYHKNNNVSGFERIAEELYAQRSLISDDVWQEVSLMGRDLAPENPLFDVSMTEMKASESFSLTVEDSASNDAGDDLPSSSPESDLAADGNEIEASSINLINFDDNDSQISELDEVPVEEIEATDSNQDGAKDDVPEIEYAEDETTEVDLEYNEISLETIDEDTLVTDSVLEIDIDQSFNSDLLIDDDVDVGAFRSGNSNSTFGDGEVSDLEVSEDYDESRTQYELAKVFVDLGDEDGARKILEDIVENDSNDQDVLDDAKALLSTINS